MIDHQRQLDLIRFCRHELHTENLITDEEYSELVQIPGAVARLESYDQAIATAKGLVDAERERCAKVAETWEHWCGREGYDSEEHAAEDIAAKIRSGK